MNQLSKRMLPEELSHLPVFPLDSAEILRDGILSAADVSSKNKTTQAKVRHIDISNTLSFILIAKCLLN